MSHVAEQLSRALGYELPYPPAITRRQAPPAASADDAMPMPPFSAARMQLLNPDEMRHALAFDELVTVVESPANSAVTTAASPPTETPVREPPSAASALGGGSDSELV